MDKKYNTEFGTLIDQRLLHQSLVVFLRLVFTQEPKFYIWVLLQEQQFPTFLILSAHKVWSTQLSSPTESVEIWSIWPRREPTSSQSFMMPESQTITDL